jgi:hypothetical protein
MQIAQNIVVLGAFMGDDLRHATGTNDEHVTFHFCCLLFLQDRGRRAISPGKKCGWSS